VRNSSIGRLDCPKLGLAEAMDSGGGRVDCRWGDWKSNRPGSVGICFRLSRFSLREVELASVQCGGRSDKRGGGVGGAGVDDGEVDREVKLGSEVVF